MTYLGIIVCFACKHAIFDFENDAKKLTLKLIQNQFWILEKVEFIQVDEFCPKKSINFQAAKKLVKMQIQRYCCRPRTLAISRFFFLPLVKQSRIPMNCKVSHILSTGIVF